MKEIDPIAGIHWKITMKEIGPIAEIHCTIETGTTPGNTKETGHTLEIDHMTEMIHIAEIEHMSEINHTTEIGLIVEIDRETTVEMNIGKKIIGISKMRDIREIIAKTNHIAEIGHIVEIGCKAIATKMTIEMSIRRKIIVISKTRDMREGLEITIKMLLKTGTARIKIGINIETDIEMTAMTEIEVGLQKEVACLRQGKMTSQRLKKSTKSYDSWVEMNK